MNLDRLFTCKYDKRHLNCLHFASLVWNELTGRPLPASLGDIAADGATLAARTGFRRLSEPVEPCLVVGKADENDHVGVYAGKRVLHITENFGVQHIPLWDFSRWYKSVRFFKCQS